MKPPSHRSAPSLDDAWTLNSRNRLWSMTFGHSESRHRPGAQSDDRIVAPVARHGAVRPASNSEAIDQADDNGDLAVAHSAADVAGRDHHDPRADALAAADGRDDQIRKPARPQEMARSKRFDLRTPRFVVWGRPLKSLKFVPVRNSLVATPLRNSSSHSPCRYRKLAILRRLDA